MVRYTKVQCKTHGWHIIAPDGSVVCWIGDAAIADRLLRHLNRTEVSLERTTLSLKRKF